MSSLNLNQRSSATSRLSQIPTCGSILADRHTICGIRPGNKQETLNVVPIRMGAAQYMGVIDDWSEKSSLEFRKISSSAVIRLMGLDLPGLPEVVPKYNMPMMWAHHCVLTTQAISGHNKQLLPVLHRVLIPVLFYIQYTSDTRDGMPMISVGRYFRNQ